MKFEHNYKKIDGWFNMEHQYNFLISNTPDGGTFVELGAWKGKSTSFVATEIANRNLNLNFFTVDNFKGKTDFSESKEISVYLKYDFYSVREEFQENTKHLSDYFELIVSASDEAASRFQNESVDTIFIDAGHSYESVMMDLSAWYPKMKKNQSWQAMISTPGQGLKKQY